MPSTEPVSYGDRWYLPKPNLLQGIAMLNVLETSSTLMAKPTPKAGKPQTLTPMPVSVRRVHAGEHLPLGL